MCELCDEETRPKRRKELFDQANDLVKMAAELRDLAVSGFPHNVLTAEPRRNLAARIIKFLAEDWL